MNTSFYQPSDDLDATSVRIRVSDIDSPSAILDADGSLCATNVAFDELISVLPNGHRELTSWFSTDTGSRFAATGKTYFSVYHGSRGEHIPISVQAIPVTHSNAEATLLLILDGNAFRRAETERFEATPCPILRLTSDAKVSYCNTEALKTFGGSNGLIGDEFAGLFDQRFSDELTAGVAACVEKREHQSFNILTSKEDASGGQMMHLVLTPDFGPDGQPLGALVVVQDSTRTIRDQIRELVLHARLATDDEGESPQSEKLPWQRQFDLVLAQIRKAIDFDHANFGIYADNVSLFRAMAMHPDDSPIWPARWLRLPAFVPEFLDSDKTWIPDVQAFVAQDPALLESEVVRCYNDYGIRSSLTLVVRRNGVPTSALSLCSREPDKYDETHLTLLRELDIEPVLLRYEEEITLHRQQFCRRIENLLGSETPLRDAAITIIEEIAHHFKWDYAALFRINRHRERFELFHQCGSDDDFLMPPLYQQPISDGMLAATLSGDCVRIVNDIGNPDVEQFGYVGGTRGGPGHRKLRSAMTIPVHLNGRARWVLDVECEVSHAFCGPDEVSLKEVVRTVEQSLTHRLLCELKDCLLKETDRGVAIVGTEGSIMELNDTAAALLGIEDDRDPNERWLLSDFAADERSRDVLSGLTLSSNQRIDIKALNGTTKVILATRVDLDTSFDMAVWFLTDVEGVQWNQNLRFLHETVSDVAQQTRAPLTMASLLAREWASRKEKRARSPVQDDGNTKPRNVGQEILAEISKADLTFERLAEALTIRMRPIRFEQTVDLTHCIKEVIECFPERDRNNIDRHLPSVRIWVKGDAGRLTFAFRSILGYLLRIRQADDAHITVTLTCVDAEARVELCAPPQAQSRDGGCLIATDALTMTAREAKEASSLSLATIQSIVSAHHAQLETKPDVVAQADGSPRWIGFKIIFPTA